MDGTNWGFDTSGWAVLEGKNIVTTQQFILQMQHSFPYFVQLLHFSFGSINKKSVVEVT